MAIEEKMEDFKCEVKVLSKMEDNDTAQCFFTILGEALDKGIFCQPLKTILETRPKVSLEHLAYLIFVSMQYLTNFKYDDLWAQNIEGFRRRIVRDLRAHEMEIVALCQTKNVSTNVIDRYAGLQIVASLMNREQPLNIIDLGCSMGLGLMALNTDVLGSTLTRDSLLAFARSSKIEINQLVGLDIQDPDLNWLKASILPQYKEQSKRHLIEKTYERLEAGPTKFKFVKGDLLNLDSCKELRSGSFDIAWTSSTCYEVEGDPIEVEDGIRKLLTSDGLWLHAYFRKLDLPFGGPENPYVVMLYPKRDWSSPIEVLSAENDMVECIRRGTDFDSFYRDFTR